MVTMFENRGKNSHYFVIARAQKKVFSDILKVFRFAHKAKGETFFMFFRQCAVFCRWQTTWFFNCLSNYRRWFLEYFFYLEWRGCSLTVVFFQQTLHKNKPRPHLFLGAPWGVQQRESILTTMVSMVVSMTDFGRFTTWFFLAPKHKSFWILRSIVKSYLTRRRGGIEHSQWFKNHQNCLITVFIKITFSLKSFTLEL